MKVNEKRLEAARTGFIESNRRFRDHDELPTDVYAQLEANGVDIKTSYLIDWFPDGGDTYVVKLLLADGSAHLFDVCKGDSSSFMRREETTKFMNSVRKNKQKPWVKEVVVWNQYNMNFDV